MWRGYGGCSKEERLEGKKTVDDMMAFVKQYRHQVLSGSSFPGLDKATCIAASSRNPALFFGINKIFKVYRYFKRRRIAG